MGAVTAIRMGGNTIMIINCPRLIATGLVLGLAFAVTEARADAAETLVEQCHAQLDLSASGCDCIGNKAREDLTTQQQDFVVAQVTSDAAAAESLMSQMTVEEMTQAAEWMMNAPTVCEQE
jgi:hypothetical protein